MHHRLSRFITAAVLLGGAASASAQGDASGWYFGVGVGGSDYSGDLPAQIRAAYADRPHVQFVGASLSDGSDTVQQALAGYRFTPWLALEIGWQDLGEAHSFYSVRANGSAAPALIEGSYGLRDVQAAAVFTVPVGDRFELVGRAGVARTRLRYDESGISLSGQPYAFHAAADSSAGALAGLGIAWNFAPAWSVRAGVDRLFGVGQRFALDVDTNGRFDHVDAWTLTLLWKP